MADKKKRFSFADAKVEIKELKNKLKEAENKIVDFVHDSTLNQDDNIYDSQEQKFIKFYQYGFYVLLVVNIIQIIL